MKLTRCAYLSQDLAKRLTRYLYFAGMFFLFQHFLRRDYKGFVM